MSQLGEEKRTSGIVTRTRIGSSVTIAISGRFDFHCHAEFRASYESDPVGEISEYRIDFSATNYIDSSALGMLVLLREWLGGRGELKVVHCQPAVRRILEIANFQRLVTIS